MFLVYYSDTYGINTEHLTWYKQLVMYTEWMMLVGDVGN